MATEKVEYVDGEHESMLTHLDHMHHETREQTITRLEAALKVAKASVGAHVSPLATRTETVTREVTVDAPEVKAADAVAKAKRKKAARASGPARLSAADAKAVKVNQKRAAKARADAKAAEAPEPTPAV